MIALHANAPVTNIGMAEATTAAKEAATRQKRNKPWRCGKRKALVTNAECRDAYAMGLHRLCRDCSIPNILPTAKETAMAKGTCEVCGVKNVTLYRLAGVRRCWECKRAHEIQRANPTPAPTSPERPQGAPQGQCASWDDFTPLESPGKIYPAYATISRNKLAFSIGATRLLPFQTGQYVEVRYNETAQALAFRVGAEDDPRTRKITDDGAKRKNLSISRQVESWKLPEGSFEVEIVPWGAIVYLGRFVASTRKSKAQTQAQGQAA